MITLPPQNKGDGQIYPPLGGFPIGMVESSFDGTNWLIYFKGDKPPKEPTLSEDEKVVVADGGVKADAPYYKQVVDEKTGEIVDKGEVVDPKPDDSVTKEPYKEDGGGEVEP